MKGNGHSTGKIAVAMGPWRPIAELAASGKVAGKLGGDPPTEVLLFPDPTWVLADMTLVTDEASRKAVMAEFRQRKIDIVFDYEHQTLEAAENGIPAPASGWIRNLRSDAKGLWATNIDWTEKAAGFIRAGEYRYYSPVAFFDEATKRVLSLHSVALTNTPRTNNQTPLTARAAASLIEQFQKQGREEGMKKWIQILASLLKRAATSKPAELLTDAKALVASLEADGAEPAAKDGDATIAASLGFAASAEVPEEIVTMIGLEKGAPLAKVKATILTLQNPTDKVDKAEHEKIIARVTELEGQIEASTKTGAIEKLVAANRTKLSPALEKQIRAIAAKNLTDAEAIVKELPVLVAGSMSKGDPAPQGDTGAAEVVQVGDGEMRPAEPLSSSVAATCRAIMKEKGCSYEKANEIRKEREAAAAAVA